VHNDTITPRSQQDEEGKQTSDASNMMFVVVRNLKSQTSNSNAQDYELQKGDTIKLGRLKFSVKDFRSATQPANMDLKRPEMDKNSSPVR